MFFSSSKKYFLILEEKFAEKNSLCWIDSHSSKGNKTDKRD